MPITCKTGAVYEGYNGRNSTEKNHTNAEKCADYLNKVNNNKTDLKGAIKYAEKSMGPGSAVVVAMPECNRSGDSFIKGADRAQACLHALEKLNPNNTYSLTNLIRNWFSPDTFVVQGKPK